MSNKFARLLDRFKDWGDVKEATIEQGAQEFVKIAAEGMPLIVVALGIASAMEEAGISLDDVIPQVKR